MPQEPTGDQVNKLIELDKEIGELLTKAGIKTAVIILENPSPTGDKDKLMVHLLGHHYDASRLCCVVAARLRSQIGAELEGQS